MEEKFGLWSQVRVMEIQSGLHKEKIDYRKKKKEKSLYGMVWGLSGKALSVVASLSPGM